MFEVGVLMFMWFFFSVKVSYDYGMLIFMLMFCLVFMFGFRINDLFEYVRESLYIVLMGVLICVIVFMFVCFVWVGEDFYKFVVLNLESFGNFLEGMIFFLLFCSVF